MTDEKNETIQDNHILMSLIKFLKDHPEAIVEKKLEGLVIRDESKSGVKFVIKNASISGVMSYE